MTSTEEAKKIQDDNIYLMLSSILYRLNDEVKAGEIGRALDDLKLFAALHKSYLEQTPKLMELISGQLSEHIIRGGHNLVDDYEQITGDHKFLDYVIPKYKTIHKIEQPTLPPMAAEDIININSIVEKNCRWNILRKVNLEKLKESEAKNAQDGDAQDGAAQDESGKNSDKKCLYKVGQIVGARDSERKWWMSRILYIFEDPEFPYPWYYVHFEGWSEIQNEWISSPFRVRRFNPKRDFLKMTKNT